jgi:arylsulfatase A-like enzyme
MGLVNLGWGWDASNHTLAKLLGECGYETYLFGLQHEARDEVVQVLGFQHVSDRSLARKCSVVTPLVEAFLAERGAQRGRPFYARVGFSEVHRPFAGYEPEDPATVSLPDWVADTPGARQDFAQYDGCIREMDAAVGRILDALDEANLGDNTLVVFNTDHGSPFPRAKATLYDPGINTALLMRWPDGFKGARVLAELVSNVDLFPTLLEAAGACVPGEMQGRSFLPLLKGEDYTPRDVIFAEKNTTPVDLKRCIRTRRFKYIRNYDIGPELVLPTDIESSLTRRDMGNAHLKPRPEIELYDLENDPLEIKNLAGDPAFADAQRELARLLQALQEETSDPILRGPIQRPLAEEEIYRKARCRVPERSPFPRDGLVTGYEALKQRRYDWYGT